MEGDKDIKHVEIGQMHDKEPMSDDKESMTDKEPVPDDKESMTDKEPVPDDKESMPDKESIINPNDLPLEERKVVAEKVVAEKVVAEKVVAENHHDGGKMRVKCVKCGIIDDLKEDDIKLLAHIVKRYNQKANPADYVAVLSVIKGLCTDNDKHLFIFDESFEKGVADTIKEYNDAIKQNVERKVALDKICIQIEEISNELKELEKKKEYMLAEMSAGGMLIDNIELKFLKLTGTEDMEIWK